MVLFLLYSKKLFLFLFRDFYRSFFPIKMEVRQSIEASVYPLHTNTFAIPNDPALRSAYEVYKPSSHTKRLLSEQDRNIYSEALIENRNLGTLVDLSVRALARQFGPNPISIIASEELLLQVHYDALDLDMPLAECYHIREERFWKRMVLTKHPDKSLALRCDLNWKNLGISLKYVELIEECPAEYWPEEEMKDLAIKVKDFVKEMHIKRLQSLKERSFEKYFHSESETSTDEEEEEDIKESSNEETESLVTTSADEEEEPSEVREVDKTESQLELEKQMAYKNAQRKKARLELRKTKQLAIEAKKAKRQRQEARREKRQKPEKKTKKIRKKNPKSFFDIVLSESEDDGENKIIDKRNKEIYLKHKKKYDYPSEHCHHIDLRFVQYFINLETFSIEFLGPIQNRNYHERHMNFSHEDIKKLAIGIGLLPKLCVFRLRNSRMDTEKLITLCRALGSLDTLEIIDFGYDQLDDDCGLAFVELFETTTSIRQLELESNQLGLKVLRQLGLALQSYKQGHLEYLGLARNPITDNALHALVSAIAGSKHVTTLNLKGAKYLTEIGITCCIANKLFCKHPPLLNLNLCAVKISPFAADEIVKSLNKNKKILEFNCCGCDLDVESDKDINVILKRNRYILENSYLEDQNVTYEEIEHWLNRSKNSIWLKVLAERKKHNECLQNRPVEFISSPLPPIVSSPGSLNIISEMYEQHLKEYSSLESSVVKPKPEPFVYTANKFDEKEFLEHVYQPGPEERYHYFKMRKQNNILRDNIKNISMV